jgi:hypothetical protein
MIAENNYHGSIMVHSGIVKFETLNSKESKTNLKNIFEVLTVVKMLMLVF